MVVPVSLVPTASFVRVHLVLREACVRRIFVLEVHVVMVEHVDDKTKISMLRDFRARVHHLLADQLVLLLEVAVVRLVRTKVYAHQIIWTIPVSVSTTGKESIASRARTRSTGISSSSSLSSSWYWCSSLSSSWSVSVV